MTSDQVVRTYSGRTRESALDAYRQDAARALAGGYQPVSHRWTQAPIGHTLIVAYRPLTIDETEVAEQPDSMQPGGEVAAQAPTEEAPAETPDSAEAGYAAESGQTAEADYAEAEAGDTAEAGYVEAEVNYAEAEADYTADVDHPAEAELAEYPAETVPDAEAETAYEQWTAETVAAEGAPLDAEPEAVEEAVSASAGRSARLTIQVLDMHTAGEPLRMIRAGFPDVPDLPVLERRRWVAENADEVRRAIIFEPRGHSDMYGAILLPPHRADADICLLFMHNEGYSTMCGHGVIAVTTALIEESLFPPSTPSTSIRYEVPAGLVVATAATRERVDGSVAVDSVKFENVPSYLAARSLAIAPEGVELFGTAAEYGHLNVDLAFGGAYYGVVDAASLGLRVVPEQASALRRAGAAITEILRRDHTPVHPTDPDLGFVYGTIIVDHDPASSPDGRARNAHFRNVTIFADAELDRSPCGSGTSALLAQLFYRGELQVGQEFVNAGITGESFVGRVEGETRLADEPAVVTSVEGRAFISGYSTLIVDQRDPLGEGFLLR